MERMTDDELEEIVKAWLAIPPARTKEESMARHPANSRRESDGSSQLEELGEPPDMSEQAALDQSVMKET